eukprot:6915220-Alexandrium_andersonii.AAC.1
MARASDLHWRYGHAAAAFARSAPLEPLPLRTRCFPGSCCARAQARTRARAHTQANVHAHAQAQARTCTRTHAQ